jgi:hypothetical protein
MSTLQMGKIPESFDIEDVTPKGAMVQFLRLTTGDEFGRKTSKIRSARVGDTVSSP